MSFLPNLFSNKPVIRDTKKFPKITKGDIESVANLLDTTGDLLINGGQAAKAGGQILKEASKAFPDK